MGAPRGVDPTFIYRALFLRHMAGSAAAGAYLYLGLVATGLDAKTSLRFAAAVMAL